MLLPPIEPNQYRAIRYTDRLAEADAVASVGSRGDSYDNALAEAYNSLFKAELIRNKGPWHSINDVEIAVAEYVDWFNERRLHGELGAGPTCRVRDDACCEPRTDSTTGKQITDSLQIPGLDRHRLSALEWRTEMVDRFAVRQDVTATTTA